MFTLKTAILTQNIIIARVFFKKTPFLALGKISKVVIITLTPGVCHVRGAAKASDDDDRHPDDSGHDLSADHPGSGLQGSIL
jgi:hypothetical protein